MSAILSIEGWLCGKEHPGDFMNQRREHFEESFALTAVDPGSWVEQAQGMRIAAEPILQSLLSILNDSQVLPDIRLRKLAYVRAYMLLIGCAFENLLKAIAAKRGLLTTNPNLRLDPSLSREKGGHGLTGLVRSLHLELTPAEKQYLQRLEEYVYWAGRYPVSTKRDTYVEGHSTGRLSFTTSDPEIGGALFNKLANLVKAA